MIIHRHWYFFVRTCIHLLVWAFVPLLLWELLIRVNFLTSVGVWVVAPYAYAGFILWFLVMWCVLAVAWTDYYLDTWTINDISIQSVEQTGFFDRRITTWPMDIVLDVSAHTDGLIPSVLQFGSLTIETAGELRGNKTFEGTPRPEHVKELILSRVRDVQRLAEKTQEQALQLRSVSHDAKGHLAKSQAVLAGIVEGDFGVVPDSLKSLAESALTDARKGVSTMMNVLHPSVRKVFDFGEMVHAEAELVRSLATAKNLTLTVSTPSLALTGDVETLSRDVVRNILTNAVIYTPSGSISVTLTKDITLARLTIEDTGVGITAEDMARLFTAGGRGTHSTDINPESSGNGLYLAQQVVQAHGGRIWAESDGKGKGTRFTVTLPIRTDA